MILNGNAMKVVWLFEPEKRRAKPRSNSGSLSVSNRMIGFFKFKREEPSPSIKRPRKSGSRSYRLEQMNQDHYEGRN